MAGGAKGSRSAQESGSARSKSLFDHGPILMTEINQAQAKAGTAPTLSIAQMLGVMRVEFHRARTQCYPLCCLMVAVDSMPRIFERHGWEGKDAAMRAVYELLKGAAREHGFFGMAILSGDRVM